MLNRRKRELLKPSSKSFLPKGEYSSRCLSLLFLLGLEACAAAVDDLLLVGLLIISHHCSACIQAAPSQHISAPPNTHKSHLIHPCRNAHPHTHPHTHTGGNRVCNVCFLAHKMHTRAALRSVYPNQDLHLGGITLSRHLFQHTAAKLPICASVSSH